jgi:hypothetical protein
MAEKPYPEKIHPITSNSPLVKKTMPLPVSTGRMEIPPHYFIGKRRSISSGVILFEF